MEKKSNHQANIVRIPEAVPHTNADNLELIHLGGYQVVVRKGDFKAGDLAVYIQPDSVVPQTEPFRFIWGPYQDPTDPVGLDPAKSVPEKKRRITVRKFRGEWSEGLLLSVSAFPKLHQHNGIIDVVNPNFTDGTDVSDIIGVTHYDPEVSIGNINSGSEAMHAPRRRQSPKTLRGWFYFLLHRLRIRKDTAYYTKANNVHIPEYDVEAYKNYKGSFPEGEQVVVTEKIHGSNARFICLDGVMYAGSRKLWKSPDSNCVWRKALAQNPWIEDWCRTNPGFALYGEVVPTQGKFNYGCEKGKVRFFLFDILDVKGDWVPYPNWEHYGFHGVNAVPELVPVLYVGPFSEDKILSLVDGPSLVSGAKHLREGIVVKTTQERQVRGLGRLQLKLVSNAFLDKDSK